MGADPIYDIILKTDEFVSSLLNQIFILLGIPMQFYEIAYITVMVLLLFLVFLLDVLVIVWLERKLIGRIHHRRSVTETGPAGFLQNVADVIKLMAKEDVYPATADRFLHNIVPALAAALSAIPLILIPFGPGLYLVDMNTSAVLFFAITTLVPGIVVLAGWASNSKYPTIGAFRAGLQLISYEIPLSISLVAVILMANSMNFINIVEAQRNIWFIVLQPLGALVFFIVSIMEVERSPFDIPEAEGEVLAGWRIEYSGLKFGLFYGTEYFKLFISAAAFTLLYLGGWYGPFFPSAMYFILKVHLVIVMMIWVRVTYFRPRPDQLVSISYTKLIPLSLLNLFWVVVITPLILPYF